MLPGLFEKHFIIDQILESGVKRLKLLENVCQLSIFALRIISRASERALRASSSCSRQRHRFSALCALRRRATALWHSGFHHGVFRWPGPGGRVWGMFSWADASIVLRKELISSGGVESDALIC